MTEKDAEIQELRRKLKKLEEENNALRNELCYICGRYVDAHRGACDECKYKEN